MTTETTNYRQEAADDAAETVRNFTDEILEMLVDDGKASDDLFNHYPNGDSWHHESHVDKWYSLTDAAELIDQLSDFEETDSGLWDGQQPKEAIGTCAAYTYGNAVMSEWSDLIKEINDEGDTILSDFADEEADLQREIDDLTEEADELAADASEAMGIESAVAALSAQADAKREEAEAKQTELDSLTEKKREALKAVIDECADNA